MSTVAEHEPSSALFSTASRHIRVMTSADRTVTQPLRPRLLRDVDELKAIVGSFPQFPHRRSDQDGADGPAAESLYATATAATAAAGNAAGAAVLEAQPFLWIDMKKPTRPERNEVLSWFPTHALTRRQFATQGELEEVDDKLEYFPAQGYTFLSLSGKPPGRSDDYAAVVDFMLFDHVLLTISDGSYPGEDNVLLSAIEAVNEADGADIATVFSALVSSLVLQTQGSVSSLMMDVDQLDELVLQIQPSEMDQNDMLTRIREMRHRVARFHTSLLLKERVLKQLLLPALRHTTACRDPGCIDRYQRSLTLARSSVERLRKGRDTVNLSCMNLVSGVSARLVQHCHWMDYLNHVQAQIALVVMPVAVIPGLWAGNMHVPWEESEGTTAFWAITGVTLSILLLGLIYPVRKYFLYKPPGALVPSLD